LLELILFKTGCVFENNYKNSPSRMKKWCITHVALLKYFTFSIRVWWHSCRKLQKG